jgi:hypothetical protein
MSCPVIHFVQLLFQTTNEHLVPFKCTFTFTLNSLKMILKRKETSVLSKMQVLNGLSWKQTCAM